MLIIQFKRGIFRKKITGEKEVNLMIKIIIKCVEDDCELLTPLPPYHRVSSICDILSVLVESTDLWGQL